MFILNSVCFISRLGFEIKIMKYFKIHIYYTHKSKEYL